LVESPGTAPGEPACKAGARPSARPLAGPEGIEPSSAVLETALLPQLGPRGGAAEDRLRLSSMAYTRTAPAPRTRIELVSLDRQSSCDTSRITRQEVLLARIERAPRRLGNAAPHPAGGAASQALG